MRKILSVAVLSLLSVGAVAAPLEPMHYKDATALQTAWQPSNDESKPPSLRSTESQRLAHFDLPFSTLKDWRFTWDKQGHWDLSKAERVVLKLRASKVAAARGILYARSGEGWYQLPGFGISDRFDEVTLDTAQAVKEGSPSGWDKVDALRFSLLPGSGEDAWVELAGIRAEGAQPEKWVWQVGGAKSKEACFAGILKHAHGQAYDDARHRLTAADGILSKARAKGLRGDARRQALLDARALVAQAYALSQSPLKSGLRAAWVHNGDGPRGFSGKRMALWKDAIPAMHAMGFNAVFPNMMWSGVAYYPSKIVPNAPGVAKEGDYLQQIIDAAKPLGMQVHVWKVMWQFAEGWLAEPGVSQPFREANRLQKDSHGKELPWLCPCDERNRRYELDALKEVAGYAIDGIHLDYIRYESPDAGFGDACRERFEKWSGKTVEQWPADCAPGGPLADAYGDFKREMISSFVQQASVELRAIKPKLQISAAVFAYPAQAQRSVFQDWPRWVKEGWVDFVCPMTYTEDADSFADATAAQVALVGADKLRPGIQVTFDHGRVVNLETLVDELKAADKLGTPGVAAFEWREQLQDTVMPYIRNGLWREGPYKLKFRTVPDDMKPAVVHAGERLLKPKTGSLLIDDFEDGNLVNALHGPWSAQMDANKLGSRLDEQPLKPTEAGALGSKHALGLRGHFGHNQAPWPYTLLNTPFNPSWAPADLRAFTHLRFQARGDAKALDVVLRRQVVSDYGDFHQSATLTPDWQVYDLAFADFKQPNWAAPVPDGFADATQLIFQPGSRDDEDFWFEIDNVELH